MKTDALDMIVSITQGNDQTIFNAPSAQSMPNITQPVSQQQLVHTQTQVQEYERKNKMDTRIIDETTLRIYFPRNPNADLLSATAEPLRSTLSSSIDQDRATSTQGLPLLSIAFSPSLSTILRCHMILFGYSLFKFC